MRHLGALLVAAIMSVSCSGGGDDPPPSGLPAPAPSPSPGTGPAPAPAPAPVGARGTVQGVVIDADTGNGVANAIVKSGVLTATTDAQGRYALQVPSSERVVLNFSATGYAETLSVTALPENGTATLATRLLPVGGTTSISTATGGTATVANSTASVIFPPDAFATSDSRVTVEVTPVNPARDPALMPGDYTTNTGGLLESGGAIIVTPRDSAGNVVPLAAGKTATIRIPLSTRGTAEPTMPLWFLDKATGRWLEEGVATLIGAAPNQYYEGTVTHFSTWNADVLYTSINIMGCVQDPQGARVANVRVTSDGVDYTGAAYALTNANGVFTVPMKAGGSAILSGALGIGELTNSESVGPSDTDLSRLQNCLVLTPSSNVVTMKLTWGAAPEDVDAYLYTPSGALVFYNGPGGLASAPFAKLDVDDVVGFGPEVVTITRLMVGTYTYGVHNFSDTQNPGMTDSPVRVELNVGGRIQVFSVPPDEGANTFATLFTLTVDSRCNATVTPVGTWQPAPPDVAAPSEPVYCTP